MTQITTSVIGWTAGHRFQPSRPVTQYRLSSSNGLEIAVWDYGATVVEVLLPTTAGPRRNLAIRLPDIASYENLEVNRFRLGATLGRFARSVEGGKFRLDGIDYQLDRNHGRHHFHGGTFGFDRFVWDGKIRDDASNPSLRLTLSRPDGDQGYPGSVLVDADFTVTETSLVIEYRGTTTAPTILGLCNHIFWNLSRDERGEEQLLTINADTVLQNNDELMPVGGPIDVAGTKFDFREARRVGGSGLDNCFPLNDGVWACLLEEPHREVRMRVETSQPALAGFATSDCVEGSGGVCLQLTDWPNAPNRPDFPSTRLDPGKAYYARTKYEFVW